jgi:hypothetical protein
MPHASSALLGTLQTLLGQIPHLHVRSVYQVRMLQKGALCALHALLARTLRSKGLPPTRRASSARLGMPPMSLGPMPRPHARYALLDSMQMCRDLQCARRAPLARTWTPRGPQRWLRVSFALLVRPRWCWGRIRQTRVQRVLSTLLLLLRGARCAGR